MNDLHELARKKKEFMEFEASEEKLTWCAGCGNYSIEQALERALTLEGRKPQNTLLCYDIGCHGNESDKLGAYTFHGLHGRVVSVAAGAHLANPEMLVVAHGGDGGMMSEGVNHLVHAVRSNYNMVCIMHNNENYALTVGQASATTREDQKMYGSPDGPPIKPMNACELVLGLEPTFVARGFSGDTNGLTDILRAAMRHDGFAFVEVMQVCPTFNKATGQKWYWDRVKKVKPARSIDAARKLAADLDKKISIGVLYQKKGVPSFLDRVPARKGIKTKLVDEVGHKGVGDLLKQFR